MKSDTESKINQDKQSAWNRAGTWEDKTLKKL